MKSLTLQVAIFLFLIILSFSYSQSTNDFKVCHTSDELKPDTKFFLRIENKEKHSVFVQIITKEDGESIYRLHPSAVLEQWMTSPSKTSRISVAARNGEECGMVRIVLWDYYRYVTTMIWIFAVGIFWVCSVVALGCACCVCVLKARSQAMRLNEEPYRYQKMGDEDDITSVVISHHNDDDLVPFSNLNDTPKVELKARQDSSLNRIDL